MFSRPLLSESIDDSSEFLPFMQRTIICPLKVENGFSFFDGRIHAREDIIFIDAGYAARSPVVAYPCPTNNGCFDAVTLYACCHAQVYPSATRRAENRTRMRMFLLPYF